MSDSPKGYLDKDRTYKFNRADWRVAVFKFKVGLDYDTISGAAVCNDIEVPYDFMDLEIPKLVNHEDVVLKEVEAWVEAGMPYY